MANGLTVGALNLGVNYTTLSIEACYSGDDNKNATCTIEYRKQGDADWLPLLSFRYTETLGTSGVQRAFYSKAHYLNPNTIYEVRATWADADGVTGTNPVSDTITTREDAISTPAELAAAATRFVSPSGSDSNDGLTSGTPWRTLRKALVMGSAALSDMVIKFAPGRYLAPSANNFLPQAGVSVSLVAENPAAVETNVTIGGRPRVEVSAANAGSRSIIEPRASVDDGPAVFAPTGTSTAGEHADLAVGAQAVENGVTLTNTVTRVAPWTQVTLTGADSQPYTAWKATGLCTNVTGEQTLGYATSRDGSYTRLAAWWGNNSWSLGAAVTPATWAQAVTNSPHFNSGHLVMQVAGVAFTENGSATTTNRSDIYVIMPTDAASQDPNDYWWKFSAASTQNGKAITFLGRAGSALRCCGFELSVFAQPLYVGTPTSTQPVQDVVIDHCLLHQAYNAVFINSSVTPIIYPERVTIQYNRFEDTKLGAPTAADPLNDGLVIPWYFIKTNLQHDASLGSSASRNIYNECVAVLGGGLAKYTTVRYNTVDGFFDFCSDFYLDDRYDRYTSYGSDIYGNIIRRTTDDVTDLSRHKINVSVFDNRTEECASQFSQAPNFSGPTWYINNECWRFGNQYRGRIALGDPNQSAQVTTGQFFKYSGSDTDPQGVAVLLNNTAWSDVTDWSYIWGINPDGGGGTLRCPGFYVRNNIIRTAGPPARFQGSNEATDWDEDYNDWSGIGDVVGHANFNMLSVNTNDVAAYRTALGDGTHSNPRGTDSTVVVDTELVDPTTGDVRLKPASSLRTAGLVIGNVNPLAAPVMGVALLEEATGEPVLSLAWSRRQYTTRAARWRRRQGPMNTVA